jgi:hypothetical protein
MTTVQESTNGHRVYPPPLSVENPDELNRADFPTNKANVNSDTMQSQIADMPSPPAASAFPANAYHVPPSRYTPKAYPYRHDDTLGLPPETSPLPERCQFMFSDGRQCTMARSDIHPSLCHYHSEREEQLFGTPSPGGGSVVGACFDLPELYSACRDLTTAAGVNRALGQVFRLLAQRRISRQEAATFAKLGHLLLQSISAARTESTDPISPPRKGYPQDALFAGNQVVPSEYHERGAQFASRTGLRGISPELTPEQEMSPASSPRCEPVPSSQRKDGALSSEPAPITVTSSTLPIAPAAGSEPPVEPGAPKTSFGINTCVASASNSRKINTYKNVELKPVQNEHLQKSGSVRQELAPVSPVRGDTN